MRMSLPPALVFVDSGARKEALQARYNREFIFVTFSPTQKFSFYYLPPTMTQTD